MTAEKCTGVYLYFTNPLDTLEPMADPIPVHAGSKKPWHLCQMLDNEDARAYLGV